MKSERLIALIVLTTCLATWAFASRHWTKRHKESVAAPNASAQGSESVSSDADAFDAEGDPSRFGTFLDTCTLASFSPRDRSKVDYNRQIKPILSTTCYSCHGPASQRGKLRLDLRRAAVQSAIVPGDSAASPLLERIASQDPDERMPPLHAKKPALTPEQIDLIRRWIDEGARYEEHWSFMRPARPPVPQVQNAAWVGNPIDAFIAVEHEAHGLGPTPEADRRTLIRRLSFDVTGLPPTPEEVEQFANDKAPDAYERVVDRLLTSPHYGERMAVAWLDLVRYADTEGYQVDSDRRVSMYRDFVINAFNRNERFDHFTIRQLAGDLLARNTAQDRIASGYNRLLMNSQEGCAEPEERKARYASDRVRNVSSVWLGLTMGCAECHDHKFDPLTTKEFYRLAAFFADIQETPVGPQMATYFPSPEQALKQTKINQELSDCDGALWRKVSEFRAEREQWEAKIQRDGFIGVPDRLQGFIQTEADKRTPDVIKAIEFYYASVTPELAETFKQWKDAAAERTALEQTIPATLVTTSGPARLTRILPGGNWDDTSGEVVTPGVPFALMPHPDKLPSKPSRLELARWLVSPQNPLTARVFVNRLWKVAFGNGLVRSVDDFGSQGNLPSHPELLDWLAVEFMERNWDVKAMLKLILTSNTYRQSSATNAGLQERDPGNVWLARQNRFRLDAEYIRDNALAISGLLVPTVGGESVKPYQPEGYWADRFLNQPYKPATGGNQHRRGLYTFWCRNYLHPSLLLFDAPSRQSCTGERARSATPLQALALLNDPSSGEAARALAYRLIRATSQSLRFNHAFRLALARDITAKEKAVLEDLYVVEFKHFEQDREGAKDLVSIADGSILDHVDVVELAAWMSVTRVILNLRETVTRY